MASIRSSLDTARQDVAKNFLNIRDFYNFIRDKSGSNSPTSFWHFSVNFYLHEHELTNSISYYNDFSIGEGFFVGKEEFLAKFRYCIQGITFPQLALKGVKDGVGGLSEAVIDISNLWGGYNILANSYVHASQHTIQMVVLNTQVPIVERFLYPWMMAAVNSKYDVYAIPKLNMSVKFWGGNVVVHDMENVKPTFIYYMTGLFLRCYISPCR